MYYTDFHHFCAFYLGGFQSLYDHFSVTVRFGLLCCAALLASSFPFRTKLRYLSFKRLPSGLSRRNESWSSSASTISRGASGTLRSVSNLEFRLSGFLR